ncbi:hypothetical protein AB685_16630 [Bacillus sp. LL01]|uniref:hypothetical protein n=1 Tax=Bacillus sp. LL01 TaxID=1665556 RepID=UPI00064CE4CC|nr:hypothetical protein [Bacillus sp. LL01]KMJ57621.1 hypothetical protein AB685_16630 [Bacillus sp. LL01]
MQILAVSFGSLGAFILFNFFLTLLYILSKSAGNGFYRWITHDLDFLIILSFPLFGLTQWVASSAYERFNWFVARALLILYAIIIFILAIVSFIVFGYIEDNR